jgi:hypothetical protein
MSLLSRTRYKPKGWDTNWRVYVVIFEATYRFVGFEVLAAVVMNVAVFWDTAPYSPYATRRFG